MPESPPHGGVVSRGSIDLGAVDDLRCASTGRAFAASSAAMGCLLVGGPIVGGGKLNEFWSARLPSSRKGTRWDQVLQTW